MRQNRNMASLRHGVGKPAWNRSDKLAAKGFLEET
jgi:hypothetical protein